MVRNKPAQEAVRRVLPIDRIAVLFRKQRSKDRDNKNKREEDEQYRKNHRNFKRKQPSTTLIRTRTDANEKAETNARPSKTASARALLKTGELKERSILFCKNCFRFFGGVNAFMAARFFGRAPNA